MAEAVAIVLEFSDSVIACWPTHVLDTTSSDRADRTGGNRGVPTYEIGLARDLPRRFVGRQAYLLSSQGDGCWVHCQTERRLVRRR